MTAPATPSRATCLALATGLTLAVSLGAGLTAALLLNSSTLTTRITAFCYTAAPLLMVCVTVCGPLLDLAERRRTRTHRARRR